MCYAPPVMLRRHCSCAISERPTPSPFVSPSLFRMLSPLLPLHPRNSPVTPLFPLHTQKQGGWGPSLFASCLSFLSARRLPRPGRGVLRGASFLFRILFLTTSHSLARRSLSGGGSLATKSNYSRTYGSLSRKSNHSRTYAKTGGWGCVIRMVTYLKYVGAPTFQIRVRRLRHGDERSLQGLKPIGFRSLTPGLKPRPPKEGGKDWGVFFLDSLHVGAPDRAGTGAAPTP